MVKYTSCNNASRSITTISVKETPTNTVHTSVFQENILTYTRWSKNAVRDKLFSKISLFCNIKSFCTLGQNKSIFVAYKEFSTENPIYRFTDNCARLQKLKKSQIYSINKDLE